jgi:ATP-dependent Zn protease
MRQTFAEARRYAPSILFIDEIDSIGNRELFTGSNSIYQTEVVNALLEQIQGMDPYEPVIVIGATNHVEKVDPALRRAGRLDQVIQLPRPSVAGLEQIFSFYLAPHRKMKHLERDVKPKVLAQLAFGLTGADVEFFVRGAARRARKAGSKITQADLVAEVTRRPRRPDAVIRLTPEDMRRVAVHETGHALSALSCTTGAPELTFVSIIPRMDGSLGFTASMPPEGAVMTRTAVLERLRTILAGRAAEEVVFGKDDISLNSGGGPSSDLAVATRTAVSVICTSGFGADGSLHWTSTPTAAQSRQVDALLRSAYRAAVAFLRRNRAALDRIADELVERQELDGAAVRALLNKPGASARTAKRPRAASIAR